MGRLAWTMLVLAACGKSIKEREPPRYTAIRAVETLELRIGGPIDDLVEPARIATVPLFVAGYPELVWSAVFLADSLLLTAAHCLARREPLFVGATEGHAHDPLTYIPAGSRFRRCAGLLDCPHSLNNVIDAAWDSATTLTEAGVTLGGHPTP